MQMLILTLDCLKKIVGIGAHDGFSGGTEVAWEVPDGHAGAVDHAVVTGEEEVHIFAVADEGLINGPSARVGETARVEGLR